MVEIYGCGRKICKHHLPSLVRHTFPIIFFGVKIVHLMAEKQSLPEQQQQNIIIANEEK